MSDPQRIAVIWAPEARADLRTIDRDTALQILYSKMRTTIEITDIRNRKDA